MKARFTMTVLVIMVAIAGSLFAKAHAGPGGFGAQGMAIEQGDARHQLRFEKLAEVLELTEDQRARVEQLLAGEAEHHQGLREQLHQGRQAMRLATENGAFDEAQFRALATKQAQLRIEQSVARARVKSQIFALLTPEQQSLAKKLHSLKGLRDGKCREF